MTKRLFVSDVFDIAKIVPVLLVRYLEFIGVYQFLKIHPFFVLQSVVTKQRDYYAII